MACLIRHVQKVLDHKDLGDREINFGLCLYLTTDLKE